jgi:hypothetical protein
MTTPSQRHPFLDDLDADVELVSSVLRQPVRGRDAVLQIVKAGARQYATQTPTALDSVGEHSYFAYDVTLHDGQHGAGLVAIRRNAGARVVALHIAFSPLDVVLSVAAGVRADLAGTFDAGLFL